MSTLVLCNVYGQMESPTPTTPEAAEAKYARNIKKGRINGVFIPKDHIEAIKELKEISPEEALAVLEKKGFTECVVAGGSKLNHSFLSKKLLDEVYLDVEPHIFGTGITLIGGAYKDISLELIKSFPYGKGGIALRYKINK